MNIVLKIMLKNQHHVIINYSNKEKHIITKKFTTLLITLSIINLFGCDKNDIQEVDKNNPNVESYIQMLKEGTYESSELPRFSSSDIPALLEFRNETLKIENFARNGISSYWQTDCSLGMYVLWTIESIRAVAIGSESLVGRFPSQNPIVKIKNQDFEGENGIGVQQVIADAYFDWWESNKSKSFEEFKQIDPLGETDYTWH